MWKVALINFTSLWYFCECVCALCVRAFCFVGCLVVLLVFAQWWYLLHNFDFLDGSRYLSISQMNWCACFLLDWPSFFPSSFAIVKTHFIATVLYACVHCVVIVRFVWLSTLKSNTRILNTIAVQPIYFKILHDNLYHLAIPHKSYFIDAMSFKLHSWQIHCSRAHAVYL